MVFLDTDRGDTARPDSEDDVLRILAIAKLLGAMLLSCLRNITNEYGRWKLGASIILRGHIQVKEELRRSKETAQAA